MRAVGKNLILLFQPGVSRLDQVPESNLVGEISEEHTPLFLRERFSLSISIVFLAGHNFCGLHGRDETYLLQDGRREAQGDLLEPHDQEVVIGLIRIQTFGIVGLYFENQALGSVIQEFPQNEAENSVGGPVAVAVSGSRIPLKGIGYFNHFFVVVHGHGKSSFAVAGFSALV